VVAKELTHRHTKCILGTFLNLGALAQLRGFHFLDYIDTACAFTVDLGGELTRLPQGQRSAEDGLVARFLVGEVDRPQRQLGGPPAGAAEPHRPTFGAARLDD
jgi:hypothetical protein